MSPYLSQADVSSAQYAAEDLGNDEGFEWDVSISSGQGGSSRTRRKQWYSRPFYPFTELRDIPPARPKYGVQGRAKVKTPRPSDGKIRWAFTYPREEIHDIPRTNRRLYREYERRAPKLKGDFKAYIELVEQTQRIRQLRDEELEGLGLTGIKLPPPPRKSPPLPPI